jgi:hypothetical protein
MATESAEETAAGKRWVEETVKRLVGEYKIAATEFKWRDDFPGPYISTFVFDLGKANQKRIKPGQSNFVSGILRIAETRTIDPCVWPWNSKSAILFKR